MVEVRVGRGLQSLSEGETQALESRIEQIVFSYKDIASEAAARAAATEWTAAVTTWANRGAHLNTMNGAKNANNSAWGKCQKARDAIETVQGTHRNILQQAAFGVFQDNIGQVAAPEVRRGIATPVKFALVRAGMTEAASWTEQNTISGMAVVEAPPRGAPGSGAAGYEVPKGPA